MLVTAMSATEHMFGVLLHAFRYKNNSRKNDRAQIIDKLPKATKLIKKQHASPREDEKHGENKEHDVFDENETFEKLFTLDIKQIAKEAKIKAGVRPS